MTAVLVQHTKGQWVLVLVQEGTGRASYETQAGPGGVRKRLLALLERRGGGAEWVQDVEERKGLRDVLEQQRRHCRWSEVWLARSREAGLSVC